MSTYETPPSDKGQTNAGFKNLSDEECDAQNAENDLIRAQYPDAQMPLGVQYSLFDYTETPI